MKVTKLGWPQPILTSGIGLNAGGRLPPGGNDLQVLTSNGSNGRYWGENVRRITSNGSNTLLSPDVNFASGSNITFSVSSNTLTIHGQAGGGSGSLTVADEGVDLSTAATKLDFVGAGVTASGTGGTKTITIAGSGAANAHNENEAAALVNATSAGDAGSRADHFPGSSLGAAWTSEATALTAGPTVKYSVYGGQAGAANHHVRAYTPSGAFRLETRCWMANTSAGGSIGMMARDSGAGDASGNGVIVVLQESGGSFQVTLYSLDTGTYTARGTIATLTGNALRRWVYLALARDGSNTWTAYVSLDRTIWVASASHAKTFTVAKAVLRLDAAYGGYDFFDVVS